VARRACPRVAIGLFSRAVTDPEVEYRARRAARAEAATLAAARERRISDLRLLVFAIGIVLAFAVWLIDASAGWLLVPAVAFVVLVVMHERARRRGDAARRAEAFWAAGLRRLDGTWPGTGDRQADLAPADHPFAADLDLFGRGSLFERISTARTGAGVATLARWLVEPADPVAVRSRQRAVDDLRPRLDLRESIALAGDELQSEVKPELLVAWGQREPLLDPGAVRRVRAWAWVLAASNVATTAMWIAGLGPLPLLFTALVTWGVGRRHAGFIERVEIGVGRPSRELAVVAAVLRKFETEHFEAPRLVELRAALVEGEASASARIARLVRLAGWLEARKGQLFVPIAFALAWGQHFGLAVERWRVEHGRKIAEWFAALGELEALCALSGYAYERPADPFPELVDGPPMIEADDLGHPLLPAASCVTNPIRLGPDRRALVVSGSNMSGKSTYLRTVGINVVLAQCGAPVFATRMRLSPLRIGATLRVQDSLQEGASRFFAEITRLRRVMDIADEGPGLLFLLDEILHGTNSHDRRIGAIAVVQSLLERGAIGLVTTHDLALADAAEEMPGRVENVHFADVLEEGEAPEHRLVFDYRLRPGVVRTSNALDLMRAVGLRL
jgi:hypothetical protein